MIRQIILGVADGCRIVSWLIVLVLAVLSLAPIWI